MSAPPKPTVVPIVPRYTLLDNPLAVTSATATVSTSDAARPAYLVPLVHAGYGTKITRIGGDFGVATPVGGTWGRAALHHYSKDQPWNHDMTMIYLEQRDSVSPTKMILDGNSYLPIIGTVTGHSTFNARLRSSYEFRWRPQYPKQCVTWSQSKQTLSVWEVVSQALLWEKAIPSENPIFGLLSEGVLSNDGRYVVLCSRFTGTELALGKVDHFCVVDLEARVVGPMQSVHMPLITREGGAIDFCSISPLGNYVIIKYGPDDVPEYGRCFSVNKTTLACTVKTYSVGDEPLQMLDARANYAGWVGNVSHGDFGISNDTTLNAGGASVEVYLGGIRDEDNANFCSSNSKGLLGPNIIQSMATARHVHVGRGSTILGSACAADQHASGRCYMLVPSVGGEGWACFTYDMVDMAKKWGDEIVMLELKGSSGKLVRCGVTRTNDTGSKGDSYRSEAHAVPSPSGEKIMFASNWQGAHAVPAGPLNDFKSYILEPSTVAAAPSQNYTRVCKDESFRLAYDLESPDVG